MFLTPFNRMLFRFPTVSTVGHSESQSKYISVPSFIFLVFTINPTVPVETTIHSLLVPLICFNHWNFSFDLPNP